MGVERSDRGGTEQTWKVEGEYLRCMFTNVRSIMNKEKKEELACRLRKDDIDVLGVAES